MFDAPWHWVVLAVIVIALFGYKRLPDASRSLGRSLRIFKTEIKGMSEDDKARDAAGHGDVSSATPTLPAAEQAPELSKPVQQSQQVTAPPSNGTTPSAP